MKRLVLDVDSTINDHWRRIRRNCVPTWPGRCDPKAFTEAEVMKDKPATFCMLVMNRLERTFDISYLTARGWPNADLITRVWLQRNRFPNYEKVICVNRMIDKISILAKCPPEYYVDDFMTGQENMISSFNKDIAEAIAALGTKVIVYRGDWIDVEEQLQYYERAC